MKRILFSALVWMIGFQTSFGQFQGATNPIIFADVPDMSMIRVGDTYYMSSTTMHLSPGLPIMKSKDLVNWSIVSYAYDTLADQDDLNLVNGKSTYGKGSWASSIRYHKGVYYVTTFAQTTGRTHIYTTKDIEKGPWKSISFSPMLHDHSLFFDDDGKIYMVYGVRKIKLVELKDDLTGIKAGTEQLIIEDAGAPSNTKEGLGGEGSQLYKLNGKYYLFNITWPRGNMRTVVVHRSDNIKGPYEGKMALQDLGVAQGGLIDDQKGNWYAYLFRDYGAVGRIPYLVPVKWENGWPVLGDSGKVPVQLDLPASRGLIPGIVSSDEFYRAKWDIIFPLVWQWNHQPDNRYWSLEERPGYLRLKNGRIDTSFLLARNSLSQRTIGPTCSGEIYLDCSKMKDGDRAGLALLQKNYGLIGVEKKGKEYRVYVVNAGTGIPQEIELLRTKKTKLYFRADCDFTNLKDSADFYYSFNGKKWMSAGSTLKMSYTLPHFMGYRYALFNYATKETGGWADFDYFRIGQSIIKK